MARLQGITGRLSRNVVLLLVDSGLVNVVSFASTVIVAWRYSVDVVGQLGVLLLISGIGSLLADLGAGQASTLLISRRLAAMGGPKPGQAVGAGLLQSAVGGAVLGAFVLLIPEVLPRIARAVGAAGRADEALRLAPLVPLVAVWVVAATLMQQTIGVFAGFQRMQYSLLQNAITHLPRLGICAAVALLAGPWEQIVHGWTIWYGLAAVFALGLLMVVLRRCGARVSLTGYRPLRRLRVGAALFTPLAAAFILQYLAICIIWWMDPHGQGYRSVGYYVPLWSLTRGYEVLLWPVAVALLPAVSDAHATRDAGVLAGLVRRLAVADVTRLPFADGSFDRVCCMGVLHHLGRDAIRPALCEMARLLETGGEVAIIEPNSWNPYQRLFAWVRPPERGILNTSPRAIRRVVASVPGLTIARLAYDHTMPLPAIATFLLRRWRWPTGPRMTRLLE